MELWIRTTPLETLLAKVKFALIMLYFRTVGRLFCFLAGREVMPAAEQ